VSGPTHGTLTQNADGSFSYSPALNFNGTDSFTYQATDGVAASNVATVTLTVTAVNDPPVAADDAYTNTTPEDTPLVVPAPGLLANDTDADGDPLTVQLVSEPTHGVLTANADGSFKYTPAADYHGLDSFTYCACDGTAASNVATVTISITPVNDPPVAAADAYSAPEDTPLTILPSDLLANDTDADGDPLTVQLVSGPTHGVLTLSAGGVFTYAPAANFNDTDSFTYRVTDGTADSNVATVTLTVTAVNDAPAFELTQRIQVTLDTSGFANTEAQLAWDLLNGDSAVNNSVIITDFATDATLGTAVLMGGVAGALPATVTLTDSDFFNEYLQELTFGDDLTFTLHLTSNLAGAVPDTLSFLPLDSNGLPLVTTGLLGDAILIVDLSGALVVAGTTTPALPVQVTGLGGPDQTVAEDAGPQTAAALAARLTPGPADEAGQTLAFRVSTDNPGLFAVQPAIAPDGTLTFTPARDANGHAKVTVVVQDDGGTADGGQDTSAAETFTITVTPVSDPPVAAADAYSTPEDTPLTILPSDLLANDTDADGDPLTVQLVSEPTHGVLTANADGSFGYTPAANYHGPDSFTYQATDGVAASNVATVTLTVTAVNDAPVAVDDAYSLDQHTVLVVSASEGLLTNDTDAEGDALTALLVSGPAHGSLVLTQDGAFSYTPDSKFLGTDTFIYQITDGMLASALTTVTLTVRPVVINVDSMVSVSYSGWMFNRTTATFDTLATITNTSADSLLLAPMSLVITSISLGSVTLFNPTGQTADGEPFIAVRVPDEGLAPGAAVAGIMLKFSNPTRAFFTFTSSVLAVDPPVGPAGEPSASTFLAASTEMGLLLPTADGFSPIEVIGSEPLRPSLAAAPAALPGLGADLRSGGGSTARMDGATGHDWLQGRLDLDRLWDEAHSHRLEGGKGDDTLVGGPRQDSLAGGQGDGLFDWSGSWKGCDHPGTRNGHSVPTWVRRFLLDLATEDPNANLAVTIPAGRG
jgi:VCBS repeat-containing protein